MASMWLFIVSRTASNDWSGREPFTIRAGETDSCHTKISQGVEFTCVQDTQ